MSLVYCPDDLKDAIGVQRFRRPRNEVSKQALEKINNFLEKQQNFENTKEKNIEKIGGIVYFPN